MTTLDANEIDFAHIEREVVARIRALAAVCSCKLVTTDVWGSAILRDLVIPNLALLSQFCEGVDIEEETPK